MRRLGIAALVSLLTAVVLTPAWAMQVRAGPSGRVGPGETIDDDLYVASAWSMIDGRVRGDVVAAAGTIDLLGQVDGGVLAFGGTVRMVGPVGATLRAAAGTLMIEGTVGTDAVVAAGTLNIGPNARVRRDLAAAAGNVVLLGAVGRNAMLAGGRIEIAGTVGGNVLARGDEIVVLPSAVITGNLTYSSEKPVQIAQGARIAGAVTREPYPARPMPTRQILRGARIAFGVVDFFWMLVLALVMVAVAPAGVQATADALRGRPWASLGWGALLLVAIPAAIVALMIMVIGIPLAVLLLLLHILTLFVSHTSASLAIGQRVFPSLSRYAAVAIGVGLIAIATNLPYVGWLLRLIVIALGFGAVALFLWGRRPAPPAPATAG